MLLQVLPLLVQLLEQFLDQLQGEVPQVLLPKTPGLVWWRSFQEVQAVPGQHQRPVAAALPNQHRVWQGQKSPQLQAACLLLAQQWQGQQEQLQRREQQPQGQQLRAPQLGLWLPQPGLLGCPVAAEA